MKKINCNVNNINFNGIAKNKVLKMETFENSIEQALEKIGKRVQREIPQNGSFGAIVEKFNNPENNTFAKDFSIEVVASSSEKLKDIRFVNVRTEHPHLDKACWGSIFSGTTQEVLDFFKEPKKYTELIKNIVKDYSERLY